MISELDVKYNEWLASDDGKFCLSDKAITLLKNRVKAAFIAGAKASVDIQREAKAHLLSVENKIMDNKVLSQ